MKIVFTGGGSGGHFYPLIAVAENLKQLVKENRLIPPKLYYFSTEPYDERALFENDIEFRQIPAGKMRRYFSVSNFFDLFKTAHGIFSAIFTLYNIYPDVVFAKGGYASFPTLFAARLLRIPVVIHESDSVPGRVNAWAGKFAERVAVSFGEAAKYFKPEKVAETGNPVRTSIAKPLEEGAIEFLDLEQYLPTILILGGSLGAKIINETVLEILPELVSKYQVIHQTGRANFAEVKGAAGIILEKSEHRDRYHAFDYLNDLAMRMAAGAATLVVTRAGSTIFEIANWGRPGILIPIADSNGGHQRENAFNYGRSGACEVIEEKNLAPHVLLFEINKLLNNPDKLAQMSDAAKAFAHPDAARIIAGEILRIALKHGD